MGARAIQAVGGCSGALAMLGHAVPVRREAKPTGLSSPRRFGKAASIRRMVRPVSSEAGFPYMQEESRCFLPMGKIGRSERSPGRACPPQRSASCGPKETTCDERQQELPLVLPSEADALFGRAGLPQGGSIW